LTTPRIDPLDIFRKAAVLADSIFGAVTTIVQRAETPGNTYKSRDAAGTVAEVSVTIPAGGIGEVLVSLGRGLQNYPARAAKPGESFPRGSKVRVTDVGGQTIYVDSLDNGYPSDTDEDDRDIII
jgi:hypothetical protein